MAVKIYKDPAAGVVFFEGSTVNPIPCNVGLAYAKVDESDRIVVERTDKKKRDGSNRTLWKRLKFTRVQDKDGNQISASDRQAVLDYLNGVLQEAEATDVASGYKGGWNATLNVPDITGSTAENGDWYFVGVSGSFDAGSGSIDFLVNDIVKFVSRSNGTTEWERIPNETVRVDELDTELDNIVRGSALTQYSIYVDANYTGSQQLGSSLRPFTNIQDAVDAANGGHTEILLNGEFTITNPITITGNKDIHFNGTQGSTVTYATYNQANSGIFTYTGTDYSGHFVVRNLNLKNAGAFAINVVSASKVEVDDCIFENNGWSGTGLDLVNEETGSVLGYNSSTSSLATFYSNECSEGGALYAEGIIQLEITDNTVKYNNKGFEIVDCGFIGNTDGSGFIARNQIFNNVSIGIDLESSTGDALAGNRNFVIYNNAVNNHGDTGIKSEGGLNNTISLGIVKGNWNAGIELAHVGNMRVRDMDLDNNNRAGIDAEGDAADGFSSLQIEGGTIADGATFVAEIFNVHILNTNLGSSAVKCGLLIRESVGDLVGGNSIIKVDNVTFIKQDYALDVECDLDTLQLILGDCEYVDTGVNTVRLQGSGNHSELPFSNFTVDTPYVDFVKDSVAKTISILDGQGGKVINVYDINSIAAVQNSGNFDIILTNTDKTQLRGLTEDRVFIDGTAQTGNLSDTVNALNAFLTETEGATPTPTSTPVVNEEGTSITASTGSRTIDPIGDDEFAGNSTGYNHGFVFADQGIDQGGEYYTFQIRREGIIGMGFHKSGSSGIYSYDNLGTGTGNGHYGMHWSTWFHPTPNGPWTYYGEASGQTSLLSGWYSFDDSTTGADWLADENVLMKAGLDINGHLYLAYFDTTSEDYVTIARKSSPSQEGEVYNLVVKFGDTKVRLFDTPKVHLRAETDLGTGSLGDETIYLFGTATGTLAGGVTVPDGSGSRSGFVTSASISASGQYFEFTQLGTRSTYAGLSNEDDYSATFIQTQMNASASVDEERFFYAGGYIYKDRDSWQPHGLVDADGSSSGFTFNNGSGYLQRQNSHFRVGIGTDGRITYWQSNDGTNYVVAAKSVNSVPVGSTLKFLWKANQDNAELTSLTTGQLVSTPDLTYYAIESPDGQWHYPLFQTAEEANYFDNYLAVPTGSGTSHTHVYVDDLSGTTWYMPDSGSAMNSTTHPTGSYLSGSTFNFVATDADENYAPSGFGNVTITLNEGDSLNQQVIAAGQTDVVTLVNPPSWVSLSGYNAVGVSPQVLLDNITVPSASYSVTVRTANAYGYTDGTLNIKVLNTTTNVNLPGTIHQGTFLSEADYNNDYGTSFVTSPNRDALIVTAPANQNGAVYDLPYPLDDGDSYEWPFTAYLNFGIVSESVDKTGSDIVNITNFNTRFDLLFSNKVNGSTLQFSRPTPRADGTYNELEAVGWDNNTYRDFPGGPHATTFNAGNPKDMFKLYNNAGRIELSYDINDGSGYQLFASSSELYGTGSDAPTITAVVPTSFTVDYVTLPSITYTANGAAAPNGFTLVSGAMDTSLITVSQSVVSLDSIEIGPGQRLIVPKEWAETNVLPYISELGVAEHKTLLGVSASNPTWSSIGQADFDSVIMWTNEGTNYTRYRLYVTGSGAGTSNVNSDTDGYYDHAIEFTREGNLFIGRAPASSNNAETLLYTSNTWVNSGTINAWTASRGNENPITPIMGSDNSRMRLSTTGLSVQRAPLPARQYDVVEDTFSLPLFKRYNETDVAFGGLTLNAGETYKFWLHDSSIESTDLLSFVSASDSSSAITQGITSSGTPGTFGSYLEFNVPSDVQPLKIAWTTGGTFTTGSVNIAGSTYVESVTGITLEGPAVNQQTGSNLFDDPASDADGVVWGWLSIDEQLNAGQRFIMDNAFLVDLTDAMPNNSGIFIGLKNPSGWSSNYRNNSIANATVGGARFAIYKYSTSDIRVFGYVTGATTIGRNYGTNGILNSGVELAIDLTTSGNNVRLLMQSGLNSSDDVNTTPYADWNSSYKTQTGDQGYGISAIDIMFLGDGNVSSTAASAAMDSADVDWTGLSEINVPTAPTLLTNWSKAIDFSGNNERAEQVTQDSNRIPMKMNGQASLITGTPTSGYTSNNASAKPWATAVVFKIDGNNSNQHIWNCGEGAGTNDDNIYLRVDAAQNLYFGWGRSGELNECRIMTAISSAFWYAVYIGHDGRRWASAGATASNLASTFDIRVMSSHDSFASSQDRGTYNDWNQASSTTGGRMDRNFTGAMTIGGRGSNRNFHGKVASYVTTTLRRGVAMPTTAEIEMMITDPMQWLQDYKVGKDFRLPWQAGNAGWNFAINDGSSGYSCQVWLMGDGTNDSYSNMIRNQVHPSDQNYTKLNLVSMISNDIETVNISGLT